MLSPPVVEAAVVAEEEVEVALVLKRQVFRFYSADLLNDPFPLVSRRLGSGDLDLY